MVSVVLSKQQEKIMTQKIGIIGLGIMGQPMAAYILKAGYELMVTLTLLQ